MEEWHGLTKAEAHLFETFIANDRQLKRNHDACFLAGLLGIPAVFLHKHIVLHSVYANESGALCVPCLAYAIIAILIFMVFAVTGSELKAISLFFVGGEVDGAGWANLEQFQLHTKLKVQAAQLCLQHKETASAGQSGRSAELKKEVEDLLAQAAAIENDPAHEGFSWGDSFEMQARVQQQRYEQIITTNVCAGHHRQCHVRKLLSRLREGIKSTQDTEGESGQKRGSNKVIPSDQPHERRLVTQTESKDIKITDFKNMNKAFEEQATADKAAVDKKLADAKKSAAAADNIAAGAASAVQNPFGRDEREFELEAEFPEVILSYTTASRGGKGKKDMWAIANVLRKNGITSFNGYQVKSGDHWQDQWYGNMPEAKVCILILSPEYFDSGPCRDECSAVLKQKSVFPLPVQFGMPDMSGHFLGETSEQVRMANLLNQRIGNVLPPPDKGVFSDNFEQHAETLVRRVREKL
jgi:hypothetical protein